MQKLKAKLNILTYDNVDILKKYKIKGMDDVIIISNDIFEKEIIGDLVFNTGMTGYVETITDPSYKSQIIVFSSPLIGNVGISGDAQSLSVECESIIVQEFDINDINCIGLFKLFDLNKKNIIIHKDTRKLIQIIRDEGPLKCSIKYNRNNAEELYNSTALQLYDYNVNSVFEYANNFPLPPFDYLENYADNRSKCCLINCGFKFNITNKLRDLFDLEIFNHNSLDLLCKNKQMYNYFDCFVISNGPGNPKEYKIAIDFIKNLINDNKKFMGICLGHQLIALAYGLETYKMKYGHRSHNQPVTDIQAFDEASYFMTSQNHGYCVLNDDPSCDLMYKSGFDEWFVNMNDGTNEGLIGRNFMSVQFHPEAGPGPKDTNYIFQKFYNMVNNES